MEYIQEVPILPENQRTVVTLGKFNGVHRGHQKLIRRVAELGIKQGWKKTVVAFSNRDKKLLTNQERIHMLNHMGMELLVECTLDKKLMHMSPEDFVKEILVKRLHAAHIIVGPDYRFGYQRKGNTKVLKQLGEIYGFEVEVLSKEMDGTREISSTYVREQLNEGNIEKANELLGYHFSTEGEVVHGRRLGRTIGVPTANLIPPREKLMPPNGVYVTRTHFGEDSYMGITNVGYKPTVGGEQFLGVETYLFECSEDLYGREAKVEFFHFVRPERRFESLQALKEQLDKDIETGKKYGNPL
ncbi:MAG: bifunctional riboflavin kinase/FAD synthetase [Lachnospiraceae bacterium]|nr:bifunctional riboflavin kinase/FAD synthetase [Lachnospiraceae bacterium]MDD6618694.1 bifunctional riboflavin kinase/FAD synthetase [Clostridiales bacterium]MDY4771827.1 bifunctional riboflavin kinase/FAD synthetase [Lachnospiraceae bacterium]